MLDVRQQLPLVSFEIWLSVDPTARFRDSNLSEIVQVELSDKGCELGVVEVDRDDQLLKLEGVSYEQTFPVGGPGDYVSVLVVIYDVVETHEKVIDL